MLLRQMIKLAEIVGLAIITTGLLVVGRRIIDRILKYNRNIDKL